MDVTELTSGASFSSLGLPPDLSKSPSSPEFLGDEEAASTCPLLTPSPPPAGYEQALLSSPDAEPGDRIEFEIGDGTNNQDLTRALKGNEDSATVDSTSTGSSGQEPTACVQLLGHPHHHYQHLNKTESIQENGVPMVPLCFEQITTEYFFSTWNWPIIRKSCSWVVLSIVIGMFCVAIAMVATLPKQCDPEHMWWQSATVYEIFPASFQDSNNDGVGDLIGLQSRIGYLHSLGVTAIRLNSIFKSEHYPEGYDTPQSLIDLDSHLGTMDDMRNLIRNLHQHNISIILDLPVSSFQHNSSSNGQDPVLSALHFWVYHKVNGFYLVGAEQKDIDERSESWRLAIGSGRLLVSCPGVSCPVCDLQHVALDVGKPLYPQLEQVGAAKTLWSLGQDQRLADGLASGPIGALLVLMALPGTPSLMYGDEFGLKGMHDPAGEHEDLTHMRQLPPMAWASSSRNGGFSNVLPWSPTAATLLQNENARRDAHTALAKMARLRLRAPQLYMSGMVRMQGEDSNFAVRYSDAAGVIAVERWYPRRHVLVTVANLGANSVILDLSSLYYGGFVVVSYPEQRHDYLPFRQLHMQPGQALVVELDK